VSDTGNADLLAHAAVSGDGALNVSWHKHTPSGSDGIGTGTIYFDRDADGLFATTHGFGTDVAVQALASGQSTRLYKVPAAPDRGITTNPVLAIDDSGGTNDGRLYISYLDWEDLNTDDSRIRLAYSDNDGTSWPTVTVDTASSTEFLPSVDVDQATGSVVVFYYTTDGDTSGNDDVRMRLSTKMDVSNGSESWARTLLTTNFSNEQVDANFIDYSDASFQDVHQGTAHGIFSFDITATPPPPNSTRCTST
jgi:hypothetical protein